MGNYDSYVKNKVDNLINDGNYDLKLKLDDKYKNRTICSKPTKEENSNQVVLNMAYENMIPIDNISNFQNYLEIGENNNLNTELWISKEKRLEIITEPKLYPFSTIGLINILDEETNIIYSGTGTLIAENIVLTCAHNVYNQEKNSSHCHLLLSLRMVNQKKKVHQKLLNGIFLMNLKITHQKTMQY